MIFRINLIATTFILLVSTPSFSAFYFEPEIGTSLNEMTQTSSTSIVGIQGALAFGNLWPNGIQLGFEITPKYFSAQLMSQNDSFTNIPVGISFRVKFYEKWRIISAWYWDDVLYSDFRPKFQEGFKLPKDYDVAYEGPGSFRLGLSYNLHNNIYLNNSLFFQNFSRYKKRRPSEEIGSVEPAIQIISYNMTFSWLY